MSDELVVAGISQGNMTRAERPTSESLVMPTVSVDLLVKRAEIVQDAARRVMKKDVHFGAIAGSDKPALMKPGAEMLCMLFGLCPTYRLEASCEDFTGEFHGGEPFLSYTFTCELWRGDHRVATASGCSNSWEEKYRWRIASLVCPTCGLDTLRMSKDDGGYYCWRKIGGCGQTFEGDDSRIVSQPRGRVPNPNVADLQNTLVKMAQKRALVAATLNATGASDIFTQDVEDTLDASPPGLVTTRKADSVRNVGGQSDPKVALQKWIDLCKEHDMDGSSATLQEDVLSFAAGKQAKVKQGQTLKAEYYQMMMDALPRYLRNKLDELTSNPVDNPASSASKELDADHDFFADEM